MSRILLQKNEKFNVTNDDSKIIGSSGNETVVVFDQSPAFQVDGITIDQSIERIELQYPAHFYEFQSIGNVLHAYGPDDKLVFKVPVGVGGGLELAFQNGAGEVDFAVSGVNAGKITIGGQPVSKTAPEAIENAVLGGAPSTSWNNENNDPDPFPVVVHDLQDAAAGNVTFTIDSAVNIDQEYTISGFGYGDKLEFADTFLPVSVVNRDFGDGVINLRVADESGFVATVNLVGLSGSQDSQVVDSTTFSTIFGWDSLSF